MPGAIFILKPFLLFSTKNFNPSFQLCHSRAETVSQLVKREKMLIFRNGFTPKFLKKSIAGNFNRPLFSTK
jgi:hypothetical protein